MKLKKIRSLGELHQLALKDGRYKELLLCASDNLGGDAKDISGAYNYLLDVARDADLDEEALVDEVNFCRDLLEDRA